MADAHDERIGEIRRLLKSYEDTLTSIRTAAASDPEVILCHWYSAWAGAELGQLTRDHSVFAESDRHFAQTSRGLVSAQLFQYQCVLQWHRCVRYLREAAIAESSESAVLVRRALDSAVASYIGTEHERFQVSDPVIRGWWESYADQRLAWTLAIAYELTETDLVAELIECGLNAGIHTVLDTDDTGHDRIGADIPTELGDGHRTVPVVAVASPTGPAADLGAGARLLSSSHLMVQPPPALRYPLRSGSVTSGQVMLGRQRRMAAGLDPDLAQILAAVPDVDAW